MESDHDKVNELYANKGQDYAPDSPDQQIVPEKRVRAQRLVGDTLERYRDQQRYDQGVEDDS
jgi:hypothetical protein